jgi:hypothetical protein
LIAVSPGRCAVGRKRLTLRVRRSRPKPQPRFERRADDEPFPEHLGFGPAAFQPKPELDPPSVPMDPRAPHHDKRALDSRPTFGNRSPFGDRLGWSPED